MHTLKVRKLDMVWNLQRYVEKGVWIEEGVKEGRGPEMNSKGEWGRVSTRRIGVLDTVGE